MTDAASERPPIDLARLETPVDWYVEVVEATASTNSLVADRARAGAGEGMVVVAEHQTSGRGRLDRTWETPARSALTLSVLLTPRAHAADWPWLPLLTGYAAVQALRRIGASATLKWPNDVLLGGRKLAGILVERIDAAGGPAVVVGIGINAAMTREDSPLESATSLAIEGVATDRTVLLGAFLEALRAQYAAFERGEAAALRTAYAASCESIGRDVRVSLPTGDTIAGRATGVDEGGRLLVATSGGTVPVSAGDVVHATLL